MKAIFIDSENKEVREVEIDNSLKAYYRILDCSMIEAATYFPYEDCIYVDEEGLYSGKDSFFTVEGGHQPFIGSGLVVGTSEDGETVSASTSLEEVRAKVKFLGLAEVRRLWV